MFILTRLEQVTVPEHYDQLHYLHFSVPYSQSLLTGFIWSLFSFYLTFVLWKGKANRSKLTASSIVFAAVFLHWICDWIEHPPQLPIAARNSKLLGLGSGIILDSPSRSNAGWSSSGYGSTSPLQNLSGERLAVRLSDSWGY